MDGRKRTVQIKFRVTEAERDLILEKMNSKHRKRVPTSVFCPSCPAAASAKLLVGKCPKPSEQKGAKTWTDEKGQYKSNSE